jgi:hypothetical protein
MEERPYEVSETLNASHLSNGTCSTALDTRKHADNSVIATRA